MTIVAIVVASLASFWLIKPLYEARAGLVFTQFKAKLTLEPKFKTLTAEKLLGKQEEAYKAYREAMVALSQSPFIAQKVLEDIKSDLLEPDGELAPEDLLERMKASTKGNYLELTIRWEDPAFTHLKCNRNTYG